uniref:Uncharacterized protein n=1 Tax=Spongospora subterranea TaxID=70186 RepID=A0A0H5RNE5_9EUKA|eukprot:CRZ10259.1 hypothetical protein [Spongospora subterranea]
MILGSSSLSSDNRDTHVVNDSYSVVTYLWISRFLSDHGRHGVVLVADLESESSMALCLPVSDPCGSADQFWRSHLFASGSVYSRDTPHQLLLAAFWNGLFKMLSVFSLVLSFMSLEKLFLKLMKLRVPTISVYDSEKELGIFDVVRLFEICFRNSI